ncbi:MAG: 50S ribosomal protein L25 [Patescibacteria group bacterium]
MLTLSAKIRKEKGKKIGIVRKENAIPGIVYGREIGSLPIKVNQMGFEKIWKEASEGTIINLKIEKDGGKGKKIQDYQVLIREIQRDPVSEKILHVDFYQLPLDREVEVTIPLIFEGEAPAEKELGGVLIKNLHEIKIKGLPKNLIPSIKIDVSAFKNIGDRIKIKEINLALGVKIAADPEEIVALVRKVEEEKIEAAPEEVKLDEIEVVGKEKKAEEETVEGEEKEESVAKHKPSANK